MEDHGGARIRWWTERRGAVGGLVFVVLLVVAARLPGSPPKIDAPAHEIVGFVSLHQRELELGAFLNGVGTIALLWWSSALWRLLRRAGAEAQHLVIAVMGGLVVFVAALNTGFALQSALAMRVEELPPADAKFYFGLSRLVFDAGVFGAAAMVAATALVCRRAELGPGWLAKAGCALAGAWVVAGYGVADHNVWIDSLGLAVLVAWLGWIVALSIVMLRLDGPRHE